MEKYINQSMKQACAKIEAQESWEDEQFMQELDSLDEIPLDEMTDDQYERYMQESAKYCLANGLAMSNMDQMGEKLFACCGCREGWCAGCVPDETLLDGWEG